MSRFSSLDAQHAASRDLERQRLERKIGQLRREVEVKDHGGERKFRPLARRPPPGAPTRRPPEPPSRSAVAPRARPAAAPPAGEEPEPGPAAAEGPSEPGTPSLEMAWLLAQQRQMDRDAGEVEAFLLRHDLGRYTSVLACEAGGQWASLLDLRLSDEAALVAAGIPAADARRLQAALRAEGAAASAPACAGRPPSGKRGAPPCSALPEAEGPPEPPRWGRLGRAPPGWRAPRGRPSADAASAAAAARVDAAVGGDSDRAEGASDDEAAGTRPASAASTSAAAALQAPPAAAPPPSALRPASAASASAPRAAPPPPRPSSAASAPRVAAPPPRPGSAASAAASAACAAPPSRPATGRAQQAAGGGSRPGTAGSAAGAEKACCYQCYRQVYRAHAACREGREFCGEPCAEAFCRARAARAARELELGQLRAAASRAATPCGPAPG